MLGFGQATTGLNSVQDLFWGMITETIPVLEYSRIQWVVVVVFSEFLFLFFSF